MVSESYLWRVGFGGAAKGCDFRISMKRCSLRQAFVLLSRGLLLGVISMGDACSSRSAEENGVSLCSDSLLREVSLHPAGLEALPVELRVPGEIVSIPEQTIELRSPVSGTILETYVRNGQMVRRGEPLLKIRSPQLSEWEARLRSVQAQMEAQKLRVEALERMGQDSLASILEVRNAQAELLSLEAERQQLTEQLQLFYRQGMDFVLTAPRRGTILLLGVTSGSIVEAGDLLLRLADLSAVRMQVYLYPEQFLQARVGMSGEAFLPGWEESVPFQIQRFLPAVNEETRAATGFADIPNPEGKLLPGTFFQAKLHLLRSDSAVSLPLSALILDADQRYVILHRQPCEWEVRPVELLRQAAQRVYVKGIAPGETVATHRVLFLYQRLTRTL